MMSENEVQSEYYRWFNNEYCLEHHSPRGIIFSVPNGGTRNKIEAITLLATGLLPGACDMILIYSGKILFHELKTEMGGLSKEQMDFARRIKDNNMDYIVSYGLESAIENTKMFYKL